MKYPYVEEYELEIVYVQFFNFVYLMPYEVSQEIQPELCSLNLVLY